MDPDHSEWIILATVVWIFWQWLRFQVLCDRVKTMAERVEQIHGHVCDCNGGDENE